MDQNSYPHGLLAGLIAHPSALPTVAQAELRDLTDEIAADPAFGQIVEHLENARALGFDAADPDIIRRAINAGRSTWEAAATPPAFTVLGAMPAQPRPRHHPSVVYYMRHGSLVKIGTTRDIRERMDAVGAQAVMAVEPGDVRLEHRRHVEFADLRSHKEWYHWSEELGFHIAEVRDQFSAATGEAVEQWVARWTAPMPKSPGTIRLRKEPFSAAGADPQVLIRGCDAATAIGVSRTLFAYYVKTQKINAAEVTAGGVPMYRLADVIAGARRVRASIHSGRRR